MIEQSRLDPYRAHLKWTVVRLLLVLIFHVVGFLAFCARFIAAFVCNGHRLDLSTVTCQGGFTLVGAFDQLEQVRATIVTSAHKALETKL